MKIHDSNTNLTEPNKGAYNADDAALNISDLQHAEHDADKKLREDVERVKTELFQFDAERNELNNFLRNNDVISCFDRDESSMRRGEIHFFNNNVIIELFQTLNGFHLKLDVFMSDILDRSQFSHNACNGM